MTEQPAKHRAHLTLIELLIIVLVLGVAGFFVVRGMGIAREREQRRQMVEALERWQGTDWSSAWGAEAAQRVFALVKANPKLHDAKSNHGYTPLHIAAWHDNRDIAQWLLDGGADANAKDDFGRTTLHWATVSGSKEVAELLLAKGANINANANNGSTPLEVAKLVGKQEMVDLLRKHGAKER